MKNSWIKNIFNATNKIILISFLFIVSQPSNAMETKKKRALSLGALPQKNSVKKENKIKELVLKKVSKRHKPRGEIDPNRPSQIKYKKKFITLPANYNLPEDFRVINNKLDISSITPSTLKKLDNDEFDMLMNFLGNSEIEVKYLSKKKSSNKVHSNAAYALALDLAMRSQTQLFIKVVAYAPFAILPKFKDGAASFIDVRLASKILVQIIAMLDNKKLPSHVAKAATLLSKTVIVYWAQKQKRKLKNVILELTKTSYKFLIAKNKHLDEQKIGILLGSILSAALQYAEHVREKDEQRSVIINAISNIIWATTTFIGAAPIANAIAATTAGAASLMAVASAIAINELGPHRNFIPTIKEIEGVLEMNLLKAAAQQKDESQKTSVLYILAWIRSSIHINGLAN